MTEYVRVRDTRTGHHYTVTARHAAANQQHLTVLKDDPAVDVNGRPRHATPHLPKAEKPATTTKKEK